MSEELIDSYVDRAKFGSDTVFIEAELKKVTDLFTTINGSRITLQGAKSLKDVSLASEEGIKANARLVESVKAVNSVVNQRFATEAKLATLQTDYVKQTAANNVEIQKTTKEIKAQVAAEQAQLGSRERAAAQIKVLTIQKDKLNLVNANEKKDYDEIVKKIEVYNSFLVKTGTIREKQAANVGNYQGSAKIIVDALEKERQKLIELEKTRTRIQIQNAGSQFSPAASTGTNISRSPIAGFGGDRSGTSGISSNAANASEELKKLDKQIEQSRTIVEGFSRVTEQPKFLNIAGKVGDANQELRFFTKSLIDLERNGLGSSEAANKLRKQLAELTDQIGDAKAEVKALSSDTRGMDLFAGSISFAADAFQTFAGAAVLAGASEQDAAEATKTLVAVQAVANGVKGIANELTTRGTAANKLFAFAQTQVSLAMDTSATAGVRLRAVLATIGFGAIIIAVGLLIANFSKIKDAFNGATVATKAYDETLQDYKKGAQEAVETTNKVGLAFTQAKEGVISKDKALQIYNETLGDTFGKATSLAEAERLYNEKAGTYIEIMALKSQANALFAKSAEEAAKGIVASNEDQTSFFDKLKASLKSQFTGVGGVIKDLSDAQSKGVKDAQELTKANEASLKAEGTKLATQAELLAKGLNINLDPQKEGEKNKPANKGNDDKLKAQLDFEKRNYEAVKALLIEQANEKIRQNQKVLDNENATLKEQILAIEEISDQKKNIQSIEFASQIKADKEIKDNKIIEVKKTAKEIEALEVTNGNRITQINDDQLKQQTDAQKTARAKALKELDEFNKNELDSAGKNKAEKKALTDEQYQIDTDALEQRFAAGEISQKDYNKKKIELDFAYYAESLQNEIDYQKALIELSGLPQDEKAAALRELHKLERELAAGSAKFVADKEKEKLTAAIETLDKIKDVSAKVFDFVGGLLNANAENQKNKLRAEQDTAEKKAARDIELINASTLSEQDKAAKVLIVNARLAAQKEQFARKDREIQQQQAKFAKATAIFNIILSTTQAVIKAYRDGVTLPDKIAGAVIAGVAGAAQLAVAIATPIPKYKQGKGAGNNYEGLAIVGDGGKKEIIERADGRLEITPATDTLTHIGKNDIVHPDAAAWMNLIHAGAQRDATRGFANGGVKNTGIDIGRELKKQSNLLTQIATKKELHLTGSGAGMQAIWKWGAQQTTYVNESTNW